MGDRGDNKEEYIRDNRLLTLAEAAEMLNTTPDTIRRWTNEELLPCVRLGPRRDRRFRRSDVERAISST